MVNKLIGSPNLDRVESVDTTLMADHLNRACKKFRRGDDNIIKALEVLVQVKAVDKPERRHGAAPELVPSLINHIKEKCPYLVFRGLMSSGCVKNQ